MISNPTPTDIAVARQRKLQTYSVGLAIGALALFACVLMLLGIWFVRFQDAMLYPQAIVLSSHTRSALPKMIYQQGVSQRSRDQALNIHDWYATHLGIGRRQIADGQCNHMYRNQRTYIFERRLSLTICDNLHDREFYVEQAIFVDWQAGLLPETVRGLWR